MPTCPKCRKRYPDESTTTCADDGEPLLPDAAFTGVDADLAAGQTVSVFGTTGTDSTVTATNVTIRA